jgi:hypothetical protein
MNELKQEAVLRYQNGESTSQIGRTIGLTSETIRRWLSEEGIPRRSRSIRSRKYSYRTSAFGGDTPEDAYYAGLLMADGNVSRTKPLFQIIILEKDREMIDGMKSFLGYTGPIIPRTRIAKKSKRVMKFVELRVTAPDLVLRLEEWGVVPVKARRGRVGPRVTSELMCYFFRGMFDGDGCVHRRKRSGRLYASFCGNPFIVDSFRDWCWKNIRETGSLARKSNTFNVAQFGGKRVALLGKLLYNDVGPFLKRKRDLFRVE